MLSRTGWARSVGGANPYLSFRARAGTDRAAADAAVEALEIYELPSARGCTYVLPREHFALGLQVGIGAPEADLRTLEKLGVPARRSTVCAERCWPCSTPVGRCDPARLKDELGDAVRNLGEEGKKKGQSTTLPAALGLLQAAGEIRRVPTNGRLDQQRYAYLRWSPPTTGLDRRAAQAELARLYFDWTGPASLNHFRWFSAFSVADAKAAVAGLDLVDMGGGLLAPPALAKELAASGLGPTKPRYALLAGIDALILLRRDHHALLDPADAGPGRAGGHEVLWASRRDLPDHPIVDRGRIVGLWQYDTESVSRSSPGPFAGKPDKALAAEIEPVGATFGTSSATPAASASTRRNPAPRAWPR